MIEEPIKNHINISCEDAFNTLSRLWGGELEEEADKFLDETGEDFEQYLVEYLTECKYQLDLKNIELIINRFKKDEQFYELAHMLLSCVFESPLIDLNEKQKYILNELCNHEVIWRNDMHFTELLYSLKLPNNKLAMRDYLANEV